MNPHAWWLPILVVIGVFFAVLRSFTTMLETDQLPVWCRFVGARISFRVFQVLIYRGMSFESLKEVHEEAMVEKGVAKSRDLEVLHPQDGAASEGVALVGGSTFAFFRGLQEHIAQPLGVPVVNAAYPGTLTHIVHKSLESLVVRHKPSIVVYSCGAHDLFCGYMPHVVVETIQKSHALLRAKLPAARIVIVALPVSPLHQSLGHMENINFINNLLQEKIVDPDAKLTEIIYLDVAAAKIPADVYLGDLHHLNAAGRALLVEALLGFLRKRLS